MNRITTPRKPHRRVRRAPAARPAGLEQEAVPRDPQDFTPLNAELSLTWKPILRTKPALPDADAWSEVRDKRDQLER